MLDAWVVMPNHLHGIMVIIDPGGDADQGRSGSRTVPTRFTNRPYLAQIGWAAGGGIQNGVHQTHQRTTWYAGRGVLAARLL